MYKQPKQPVVLQQLLILAWVAAGISFALGIILPKQPTNKQAKTTTPSNLTANPIKQQQVQAFNQEIRKSWQNAARKNNLIVEIPLRFRGKTIYQAKLKQPKKVIALTFDDGPWDKTTTQVLDILRKNDIAATFFVVGRMAQQYPNLVKQIAADGHILANHTWNHWYRNMDTTTAASEINRTTDIIAKITGVRTTLFRPPGGFLHNGLATYAKSQKYAVMMWSVVSGDTERSPKAPTLVKNVLKAAKPGGIVLMHDGGGNRSETVKALPKIIAGLKAQGYEFVTIPQLLEIQEQQYQLATKTVPPVKNAQPPNAKPTPQ